MFLIGLLVLLIAAPAPAIEPIEIGAILSMTGPGSFLGKDEFEALRVIENVVNKGGGIGGQPIKFNILDDQSNPQVAVQFASPLIAQHDPIILGPTLVATCRAVATLAQQNGPVTYCFTSGVPVQKDGFVFSASFSTLDSMAATLRYIRGRGWNRVAYIISNDATGQDAEASLNSILNLPENKSIQVIDREHFSATDLSTNAQMSRIKTANPQAMIAWTTGSALGTLMRNAHDVGLDLPTFTTGGNIEYAEMQQFGPFLPKDIYFSGCTGLTTDESSDRNVRRAVDAFRGAFHDAGIRPEQGHILAWDATFFAIEALKKLGMHASAAQVRDYFEGLHGVAGAVGAYDFTNYPQRGIGLSNVVLVRWDPAKGTWVGASRPGGMPLSSR